MFGTRNLASFQRLVRLWTIDKTITVYTIENNS